MNSTYAIRSARTMYFKIDVVWPGNRNNNCIHLYWTATRERIFQRGTIRHLPNVAQCTLYVLVIVNQASSTLATIPSQSHFFSNTKNGFRSKTIRGYISPRYSSTNIIILINYAIAETVHCAFLPMAWQVIWKIASRHACSICLHKILCCSWIRATALYTIFHKKWAIFSMF